MAESPSAPIPAGAAGDSLTDGVGFALLRTAVEHSANAVLITDRHGIILWVNPAFSTVSGYSASEAIGRNPRFLKSGIHSGAFYENLWRTLLAGEAWRGRITNRRKDGTHYEGEQVISPVRSGGGVLTHFVAVINDLTARVVAERALEESQALYRSLVEQLPAAIYRKDAEGRYVYVNGTFAQFVGLGVDRHVGRLPSDLEAELRNRSTTDPAAADFARLFGHGDDDHRQIMRTGTRIEFERKFVSREGQPLFVKLVKAPAYDGQGRVIGSQGIVFDITALKRTEQQLREQREQWEVLVTMSPNAVFVVRDERFVMTNPAADAMFGASAGELQGRRVFDFIPQALHATIRERLREATTSSRPLPRLEQQIRRADGTVIDIEASSVALGYGGEPAWLVEAWDITARKRLEESTRRSEERLRLITETIREVFWMADVELRESLYVSPAFERVWGLPVGELRANAKVFLDAIHEEDRPRVFTDLAARREGRPFTHEYRVVQPSGEVRWVWDQGFPVFDAGGAVTHYVGVAQDITERKLAEERLRESERRLREMLENVELIAIILDPAGRVMFCNDYVLSLTGWTRAEVVGIDWCGRFIPGGGDDIRKIFQDGIAQGTIPAHYENPIITRSGELRHIVWNNTPLRDGTGRITGIAAVGQDVTEARQNLAALRQAKERYHAIFENAVEGIFQTTPSGRFLTANPAMARILGFPSVENLMAERGDIANQGYVDPSRREDFKRLIAAQGFVTAFEYEVYRRDGTRAWVSENARAVRHGDGTVAYYEGSMVDITDRIRAEARVRLQHAVTEVLAENPAIEETRQRILETVVRGLQWDVGEVWIVDRQAQVLRCADVWHAPGEDFAQLVQSNRTIVFARGTAFPGRVWHSGRAEWVPDVSADSDFRRAQAAAAHGLRTWIGFPIRLRDEILGVVGFFSVESHHADPDMIAMLSAFGSQLGQFMERQRLGEQFRHAQKMEAIGTLAGGIAHDFNNIIAAISGFTELARLDLAENEPVRGHLDAVLAGSRRAAALVRQLLAFSRQQESERRPIQLRHIVGEALSLLRATIPATIEFDFSFSADIPTVMADATQVHQAVMNLVTNAWHAIGAKPGRVGVELDAWRIDHDMIGPHAGLPSGDYVRLSVSDTGHGMDPATARRVFEPFFTTKGPGQGTGLGLAVVHGIMQAHRGAVTVYSQPGEGTVFRLYFPCAEAAAIESVAGDRAGPRGAGERILYVDDEEALAAMSAQVLERHGYQVEKTTSALAALEFVRTDPSRIDLVITDLAMPVMPGTQLAQKLLQLRPDLPIILVTGYAASLTPADTAALGIRALLEKPMAAATLAETVARVLGRVAR